MHTHFENPLLKINFLFYIIFQKCKKKYKEIITGHKLRQNLTVTISNSRARYSTERREKRQVKLIKILHLCTLAYTLKIASSMNCTFKVFTRTTHTSTNDIKNPSTPGLYLQGKTTGPQHIS